MNASANVAGWLDGTAREAPDRTALTWAARGMPGRAPRYARWSYGDLARRVVRLAAGFRADGLEAGDRVVVFIPMSPDLYLVLLALWRAGAVAVALDPWCTGAQMKEICARIRPRGFAAVPSAFLFLLRHAPLRAIPFRIATRAFPFGPRRTPASLLCLGMDREEDLVPRAADDPALVTFTSGTTGRPKGANRTHGFLAAQHEALEHTLAPRPDDIELSHFPIFVLNSLAAGRTAVLPRMNPSRPARAGSSRIAAMIRDLGVTVAAGSPAFFDAVTLPLLRAGHALPGVRAVHTGGGPVGAATLARIRSAFPRASVTAVYGSTEAEPIAHIRAEEAEKTAGETASGRGRCAGRPVPEIRVKLVPAGEDGPREVPDGGVGEIWVAGPHVCREYVEDADANRRWKVRDADGAVWHRTGDLARRDGEGRLWLMGREGETFSTPGGKVCLGAVEAAVESVAGVARAAGVIANASGGERALCLAWTSAADAVATPAEVERTIRALFSREGWPLDRLRRLRRLPTDPRHNTKIDRRRLARRMGVEG